MTQPNPEHQVTLCHSGNGKHFVSITTDYEGALGHAHTDDDDIIPAFPGFLGQNLTVAGLYRLEHECASPPAPTTTTTQPQGDPETTTTTVVTTTTTLPTTTSLMTTTTTLTETTTTVPETTTTLTAGPTTEAPQGPSTTTEIPAEAPVAPDMLPVTGAATSALLLAAVALVGTGSYLVRRFR